MTRPRIICGAALVAIACSAAACGAPRDASDDLRRGGYGTAPRTGDEELRAAHREFVDAASRRLDALGAQLDELRARAKLATAEERDRLQKLVDDLGAEKDKAAAEFGRLRESAADKWDALRDNTERALADVEKKAADALK